FAQTVESLGDAAVEHDVRAGSWTIAAGGAALTTVLAPSRDYEVTSLVSPLGTDWVRAIGPDSIVTADGVRHAFGSRTDGFTYIFATTRHDERHVELDAAFTLQPQNLLVTRHIAVVPGSPTFEMWTTFRAMGDPVSLSNLDAFQALVSPGAIHWVTGHQ